MKNDHKRIVCFLLALCAAGSVGGYHFQSRPASVIRGELPGTRIAVIDPGHGGEDGGAVSVSGVPESRINLEIAERLDGLLCFYGVNTCMTRREDVSIHDRNCKSLREKKASDLRNRVDLINSFPRAVLISIHQNSYPNAAYHGAQVFFGSDPEGQQLAEKTQYILHGALDPQNSRSASRIPESIYLMNHISCPAILVECGFLTNAEDDAALQTPEYQKKLAGAIAAAYLQWDTSDEI